MSEMTETCQRIRCDRPAVRRISSRPLALDERLCTEHAASLTSLMKNWGTGGLPVRWNDEAVA